jgi:glycosyltransferase involved in cell wall biosynthesis
MRINICYLVGVRGDWGGASRILFNVVRKLDRDKFNPIVMLSGRGPACAELDRLGIEYQEWRRREDLHKPWGFLLQFLRSIRFFRQKEIRIVHLNHGCLGWRPAEVIAARLLQIPVLVHCQFGVRKASFDLRWASLVLTCSAWLAHESKTGPAPKRVLYDLVDLDRFGEGKSIRSELNLSDSDVVVSFVGRARRAKGLEMFLALAKTLPGENLKFLMTGQRVSRRPTSDSYSADEIGKLVAQDPRVLYLGFRDDIESIYASSDIIVVPSQVDEPCPAVLIEAGACRRPVVATNVGSIPEFLSHGENGFLVDRDDLAGMIHYVSMLISDVNLRSRMGTRARQIAEQRYAREPVAQLEEIYASLAH